MAHIIGRTSAAKNILKWKSTYRFVVPITQTPHLFKDIALNRLNDPDHFRSIHMNRGRRAMMVFQKDLGSEDTERKKLPDILQCITNTQIIYSSYIDDRTLNLDYISRLKIEKKIKAGLKKKRIKAPPLIIEKWLHTPEAVSTSNELNGDDAKREDPIISFPYSHTEKVDLEDIIKKSKTEVDDSDFINSGSAVKADIAYRMQAYEDGTLQRLEGPNVNPSPEYCLSNSVIEDASEDMIIDLDSRRKDYGTADASIPVSDVPCGGCGAHLHCQNPAFPGFIPKELFDGLDRGQLRSVLCQRCYFMKYHKMALNVRVSPEVYSKVLEPIRAQRALVIVMVDILDVPCSIWPKLIDIIGTRRPVVIVGNKVDLLPADGKNHLQRVKECLIAAIEKTDLGRANIRHVALVSAHTGFGIESLITKIQHSWGTKGDIYILGCTNSGKSTLFNALLGSDMCKTKASSLIRRATTSLWPGTTLNMLKFPILRPAGYNLYLRLKRLREEQKIKSMSDKLKPVYTKSVSVGTLSGHIGRTLESKEEPEEKFDPFSTNMNPSTKIQRKILGINTSDPRYSFGKWCYDTPGTIQPDQVINLLSHEELMKVIPMKLILPQSFCLKPGQTLFIGGIARLDLLYSTQSVRFTVFRSEHIPVTVVRTVDASTFYREYLGSELLGVPMGSKERLQRWPALKPKNIRVYSTEKQRSCADVVLSSAGWVAITGMKDHIIEMRGWTPSRHGIYIRDPPVLPLAVNLRGRRIRNTPVYKSHKIFVPRC
ncbi:nitric oxide-associated protein 1 [Panulirus ornatus]|uniref:nitric oxide-associated protein 1 n=1 Tax=Panulirus ornatus TaxID=150431 RepID=UPI003A874600